MGLISWMERLLSKILDREGIIGMLLFILIALMVYKEVYVQERYVEALTRQAKAMEAVADSDVKERELQGELVAAWKDLAGSIKERNR